MESSKYIYVSNVLKGYATDLVYTESVFDSMNAMITPSVNVVRAKVYSEYLISSATSTTLIFYRCSKIRKLNSTVPEHKRIHQIHVIQTHEALSAIQEIEEWIRARELYEKQFGKTEPMEDRQPVNNTKSTLSVFAATKKTGRKEKMFRGRGN